MTGELVENLHPAPSVRNVPTTPSGMGMWYDKIYYFPPATPPAMAGNEIASEFYVEYSKLGDVLDALYARRDEFRHLVSFSEFRPLD